MREDDGRTLDHATLEAIRMRAVRAVEDGEQPAVVARTLGMTPAAVYAWLAQARAGGPQALRAKPIPGRPAKLSATQVRRLYELLEGSDPRALHFPFALWTRELVGELISREFGVAFSLSSVGRLLAHLGLSSPGPLVWASGADQRALARWTAEAYPTIRAEAAAAGAEINFVAVTPVRSDGRAGTLISARSASGRRRFSVVPGPLTAAVCIDFCGRLLHDAEGPVVLLVEDHPVYRSRAVSAYVATSMGAVRLAYLPSDTPGDTPDA